VLDPKLGNQRPSQRREQRIAASVERVGPDCGQHVVLGELLARIDDDRLDRAQLLCLTGDHVVVLTGLAQVDGQRDDLSLVGLLDPAQHHAGVEAARIQQQNPTDLGGIGLVAGDSRLAGLHNLRRLRRLTCTCGDATSPQLSVAAGSLARLRPSNTCGGFAA
jgi:hypothetical protein